MSELRPTKYLLKKLQELLLESKKQLILAIVLLILSTFCLVYAPKLLGKIVNSILSYSFNNKTSLSFEASLKLIIEITILYILGYSFRIPITKIMARINEKTTAKLKFALYDKLNYVSPTLFNNEYSGNIFSKLNNDVANIKSFINKTVILFLSDILMIVLVLVSSLTLNIQLSMVFIFIVPFYIFLMYKNYKETIPYYNIHKDDLSEQMGII